MEKVRPWCGQPSDRGRLKNKNILYKRGPGNLPPSPSNNTPAISVCFGDVLTSLIGLQNTRNNRLIHGLLLLVRVGLHKPIRILLFSVSICIFTARCYTSAVLAMGLCPSVSVYHKSVLYRNGGTNRAGFWHVSFLPPVLRCVKRKFGYLQK